MKKYKTQTYKRKECISFAKVDGPFGSFHNMAPHFPITLNGYQIKTSEHLYQAMRFTHRPDIQEEILKQASPMSAKMVMKEYIEHTRQDWDDIKVAVMGWCILLKWVQNWDVLGPRLFDTRKTNLVEYSKKDDFWGAIPQNQEVLMGVNALGQLLMRLRTKLPDYIGKQVPVKVPPFSDMTLLGTAIQEIFSPELAPFPVRTTVVNRHHHAPFDVYIGRGSKWGNPFSHLDGTTAAFKVDTREEAILSYEKWIMEPEQEHLRDALHELRGKILGCYCEPLGCHGHVLAKMTNERYPEAA